MFQEGKKQLKLKTNLSACCDCLCTCSVMLRDPAVATAVAWDSSQSLHSCVMKRGGARRANRSPGKEKSQWESETGGGRGPPLPTVTAAGSTMSLHSRLCASGSKAGMESHQMFGGKEGGTRGGVRVRDEEGEDEEGEGGRCPSGRQQTPLVPPQSSPLLQVQRLCTDPDWPEGGRTAEATPGHMTEQETPKQPCFLSSLLFSFFMR